jgi:hypothetical protein
MQKAPLQEEPLINGRWTAPWHRWLDSISLAFNSLGRQFIDLEDVPSTYTGQAGKVVKVKATEDGLEFGVGVGISDHTLLSNIGTKTHAQLDSLFERAEIESLFKAAQSTKYTEYTYSSGSLTSVDIWSTSAKTLKLFTKTLSYTGADLTGITIVDEVDSNTLTKVLAYSGGNLSNKTEVLT